MPFAHATATRYASKSRARNEILSRYGVTKPEDIKAKIAKGELKAHPAFEDYLSALTYQIDMEDMLKTLEQKLNELRGPT